MLHLREIHYTGLTKSIIPYGANKQMNKETNKKLQTKQKHFLKNRQISSEYFLHC